jgi:hypothetical protein
VCPARSTTSRRGQHARRASASTPLEHAKSALARVRTHVDDKSASADSHRAGDLALASVVGLGALWLYVATMCPTIYVEDSAEFATAAAELGVPHPPGYPLHTLLAALFVRVIPLGDIAYRSNLFSASCGAAAVAVLWLLLRRLDVRRLAALAGTFCFAFGTTFWSQCLAAEVHALNALLLGLTLFVSFDAARAPSRRTFALAGFLIGLTIGHRNLNLLFLAPLLVLLARASRGAAQRRSLLVCALGAMTASGLVYLYLPLAARRDPMLDMGAPVTFDRFCGVISAHAYFRHMASASLATNARRAWSSFAGLPANLGVAVLAAPLGFLTWHRRDELARLVPFAWMAFTCFLFSTLYNVLDVASYLIPAFLALAVAAAVGFDALSNKWRVILPLAALVGIPTGLSSVNLRHTSIARVYGRQLLESAPPLAIVISFGDTETHLLTYEQAVEHEGTGVIVVSANEIDDWYVQQLSRRHPEVVWPPARAAQAWLVDLAGRSRASHPICLTQPLSLGLEGLRLVPRGLLFCLAPRLDERELERSVAFWRTAVTPSAVDLEQPEVHVQMIDFAFSLSRFLLAGALAEIGNMAEARAQLGAVVAAKPDAAERAIVAAMKTIGRENHHDLSLGARAQQALQLDPGDSRFLALLGLR